MTAFQCILMGFLIVCAVSVSFSKNLLNSILQSDYVHSVGMSGVSRSGNHGSSRRRRRNKYLVLCHAQENSGNSHRKREAERGECTK